MERRPPKETFEEWKKDIIDRFESTRHYFDRKSSPLSIMEWSKLCNDDQYKIIKQETLGKYFISTVWIGLNMSFLKKSPALIFETMIFLLDENDDINEMNGYQERYSTEEEALIGHETAVKIVKEWLSKD